MAMNMGASPTLGMAWRAAALAMLTLLAGCDRIAFWFNGSKRLPI